MFYRIKQLLSRAHAHVIHWFWKRKLNRVAEEHGGSLEGESWSLILQTIIKASV